MSQVRLLCVERLVMTGVPKWNVNRNCCTDWKVNKMGKERSC